MATQAAPTNGTPSGSTEMTPAQKLMADHAKDETHVATVEEVVDEDDLAHPPPSASLSAPPSDQKKMSAKLAGKQKAQDTPLAPTTTARTDGPPSRNGRSAAGNAVPDTQSEELFPALGAPKTRGPSAPVIPWGKKTTGPNGVGGPTNGASLSSNASSRASTPASGMTTPVSTITPQVGGNRLGSAAVMSLPGRHKEHIAFSPSQLIPRSQLKKPVLDVLRDINRRSKAKVEMRQGQGGSIIFEGQGPVDAVRTALKDVANQLGSKVTLAFG